MPVEVDALGRVADEQQLVEWRRVAHTSQRQLHVAKLERPVARRLPPQQLRRTDRHPTVVTHPASAAAAGSVAGLVEARRGMDGLVEPTRERAEPRAAHAPAARGERHAHVLGRRARRRVLGDGGGEARLVEACRQQRLAAGRQLGPDHLERLLPVRLASRADEGDRVARRAGGRAGRAHADLHVVSEDDHALGRERGEEQLVEGVDARRGERQPHA